MLLALTLLLWYYRLIMKLPKATAKRTLLITIPFIFVSGSIATFYLSNDTPSKKNDTIQTKSKENDSSSSEKPAEQKEVSPAPEAEKQDTPPVVPAPTPEENRLLILKNISDYAASRGANEREVERQKNCMDQAIVVDVGYASSAAIMDSSRFPLYTKYINGEVYFGSPGMCSVVTR